MITATMTALDIWSCMSRDRECLQDAASGVAKKLIKEARKRRVDGVWKCIDYSRGDTKYKIVVHGKRDASRDWACYLYCSESNRYVRVTQNPEVKLCVNKLGAQAYTPHFIRRVSERLYHDSVFDINRTFARFERDMVTSKRLMLACLYHDESTGDAVYSFLDGLALGSIDNAKHIIFFNTFVSHDMLKGSQRRAFDAYTSLRPTINEKYGDDTDIAHRLYTRGWSVAYAINEELAECKSIYAEFFKNKNK